MRFDDMICAEHLAGMLKCATVSNEDPAKMDLNEFYKLHRYLEETYPAVHRTLSREIVDDAGLLYCWKGTGRSEREPLLLTAHQDVVQAGDADKWKYPPFAGTIAEGHLWGRGAVDCKCNILSHMEAIERLIEEGYQPDCDVYLAYGYNEEVRGACAKSISSLLEKRGVRIGLVIDEGRGPGPDPMEGIFDERLFYVYTSERGSANVRISIKDEGGHSMFPSSRSIIAELGQIAVDLMKEQYSYRLTKATAEEYRKKAQLMGEKRGVLENMENDFDAVLPLLEKDPALAGKFRTTMALTMMQGSAQANVLPTEASITMNCRLLLGDTLESLLEKIKGIVAGRADVTLLGGADPSEVSRTDTQAYRCFEDMVKEIYPESILVPAVLTGGTDSRNYYNLCDTVLRASGYICKGNPNIHSCNENIPVEDISSGPEFMYRMIQKYCA